VTYRIFMTDTRNSTPSPLDEVHALRISTAGLDPAPVAEEVRVVREVPLAVDLEGVDRFTMLCTPIDRRALAAGFLFSEGIIDGLSDVETLKVCDDDPYVVRVRLRKGIERIGDQGRNLVITSSCGACGDEDLSRRLDALPRVDHSLSIHHQVLRTAGKALQQAQPLFQATGCPHGAALFDRQGTLLSAAEDTGRHNALDKVIGKRLLNGDTPAGCAAALSCRVSLEMVGKCARAGIELISAISAPTSLAIETAERCGITLCAFVRQTRATIFTHPGRIAALR
jgi:FdhD protein